MVINKALKMQGVFSKDYQCNTFKLFFRCSLCPQVKLAGIQK